MGLTINNNMMSMNASRNLNAAYGALSTSVRRLSSGLRVNSAADDAAGLAVRETMRTDIAVLKQGVRNAGDAISMVQTAEGALQVIDEKLTRMKELAEQAATGTYTTSQRTIMDSEYQAMAKEIDRIANATDFNGVKLLDGSLTALHGGSGLKVHFGAGNSSAEDYYYISIGDMRATQATGLQVGGGALADIHTASAGYSAVTGSGTAALSGGYFTYKYDSTASGDSVNDLAGIYKLASGATYGLSDLGAQINLGTAARTHATVLSGTVTSGYNFMTIGGKFIVAGSAAAAVSAGNAASYLYAGISATMTLASQRDQMITAINSGNLDVWAVAGSGVSGNGIMFMAKNAGLTGNNLSAYENVSGMSFDGLTAGTGGSLSGGGVTWATASTVQSATDNLYYLRLTGADRGASYDITTGAPATYVSGLLGVDGAALNYFAETTAASGTGNWDGADILTQSGAQLALGQIDTAVNTKDAARASLGATQNRLQNTITNLTIQAENEQAAESRISDVDVATEMTNFTRNSILVQAATAMLAQSNQLGQLALQLLK